MPLPPITLLHGDDDFAAAERLAQLKAALGDPATASLNTAELDGRAITMADLRGVCDTMPFLAEHRLVVVSGLLGRLTGRAESDEGEDDPTPTNTKDFTDSLIEYLNSLPSTTALVFVESKAISERSRLYKAVAKAPGADIALLAVPKGGALVRWIMRRAEAAGGKLSPPGAEALAAAVGDDPRSAANEIDKLLAYVNWARPVQRADVELLTPAAGEVIIWELVDALGARDGPRAINRFHALLAMPSQDIFSIFGMIVRQFRLLLQTKEVVANGGGVGEVMRALNQKQYPAEKLVNRARNFTLPQLETIYRRLLDLDLALKTGGSDDTTAVDTFIAALTA